MKRSGLFMVTLLLAVLLAGLIICLSFASKKHPSKAKLVFVSVFQCVYIV